MKKVKVIPLIALMVLGGAGTADASVSRFGTAKCGASSEERYQVQYVGAAWNYPGSGHRKAGFRYTRGGKTISMKEVSNGRVTDTVWDSFTQWGDSGRTYFNWWCR